MIIKNKNKTQSLKVDDKKPSEVKKPKNKKNTETLILGNQFIFEDMVTAWENLIKMFILQKPELFENHHGAIITNSIYTNDLTLFINSPNFKDEFDFGKYFNYSQTKWTSLLNNYTDLDKLDEVKLQIRELEEDITKNRNYNIGFQFTDVHGNGKGCLLSGIFSRCYYIERPNLTINIRASEIVTRLPFDLLFFSRFGEYVYGHTNFTVTLNIKQAFADDSVILMYNNYEPIQEVFDKAKNINEDRKKNLLTRLDDILTGDITKFTTYQAYLRVLKVLRPDIYPETKNLLAKDCIIGNWDGIPLPTPCPSIIDRNRLKDIWLNQFNKYGFDLTKLNKPKKDKKRKVVKI